LLPASNPNPGGQQAPVFVVTQPQQQAAVRALLEVDAVVAELFAEELRGLVAIVVHDALPWVSMKPMGEPLQHAFQLRLKIFSF